MLKNLIFTGLFLCFTINASAQSVRNRLSDRETITDPNIQYPVDMERNYDELLSRWSKNINYSSNCHQNIDSDGSYIPDSVYINRLYSLPTKMELVFNPVVRNYIEMYAGRRSNQVSYMLGEGKYYFPLFEEALDKEGLPLELKYLPVIESALNPIARSRVGATGLWQFMAGTGKMYDLEINSLVDERSDPRKSTTAAVKYLKDLYSIYGDWNLVIAAYNCGPGNVNKAIRRSSGQTDYWAIYPYLPKETRGYVPAFIAATYIMNYYSKHNICPGEECSTPLNLDTLTINRTLHFQQVSDVLNIPIEDIRKYNPQYKNDIIPGEYKSYGLNLPIHKLTAFIDNREAIYNHRVQELLTHRKVAGPDIAKGSGGNSLTYKVKRGDTLSKIANRYGVTVAQVKNWNNLRTNKVPVGRRLTIYTAPPKKQEANNEELLATQTSTEVVTDPSNPDSPILTKSSTETKTVKSTIYYKIRKGDTWNGIAKKHGVTVASIKQWNKTKSLIAGKQLKIEQTKQIEVAVVDTIAEPQLLSVELDPSYTSNILDSYIKNIDRDESSLPVIKISSPNNDSDRRASDNSRIIYHKVKIGETITQIAARYNVSKKDIVSWNKLSSNNAKVGQRLLIHLPESEEGRQGVANQSDNTPSSMRNIPLTLIK